MKDGQKRSELDDLRQAGSLKCLFPRRSAKHLDAVLVNTAGGVTGGDAFKFAAEIASDCTITTQAAERAYGAAGTDPGRITNQISVRGRARLNWLPQETILFDGCSLTRRMQIDLEDRAELLFCEPIIFGRTAMKETVCAGAFSDRVDIRRDGVPIYLDSVRLEGDIQAHLNRPFVADGARAMASLVYVANDVETQLSTIRDLLPETAGASLLLPDVLVLRLLAHDGFALRKSLIPVLNQLYQPDLPRCWML
ncbi:urease accessory protein UreD [Gymnodinialimonas hymeniacidonis]|uniref:urease accessory protein UreD n=1 Tax=Gymnodinialimonas hymeniacidonis TaxID=3126508 RepID=UPI0034C63489